MRSLRRRRWPSLHPQLPARHSALRRPLPRRLRPRHYRHRLLRLPLRPRRLQRAPRRSLLPHRSCLRPPPRRLRRSLRSSLPLRPGPLPKRRQPLCCAPDLRRDRKQAEVEGREMGEGKARKTGRRDAYLVLVLVFVLFLVFIFLVICHSSCRDGYSCGLTRPKREQTRPQVLGFAFSPSVHLFLSCHPADFWARHLKGQCKMSGAGPREAVLCASTILILPFCADGSPACPPCLALFPTRTHFPV